MLLFLAGMRRSGSTLSYQIAHELIGEDGNARRVRWMPRGAERASDWYTVKTHRYRPEFLDAIQAGKVKVVTTIRDPRDSVVSVMTLKHPIFDKAFDLVKASMFQHSLWEESVTDGLFVCRYEDFYNNVSLLVRVVSSALEITMDDEETDWIAEKFSFKNNKERADSLLKTEADYTFPKHMQDGIVGKWRIELTSKQQDRFNDPWIEKWMEKHGYD